MTSLKRRGYWYWIGRAVAELNEWGFIGEETLNAFDRHGIDRVQVELGWADVPEGDESACAEDEADHVIPAHYRDSPSVE